MTTFSDDETGLDTSNPIELYRLYGVLGSYTYTSANIPVAFSAPSASGSETYAPTAIERSEIKLGDVTERNELKIKLPKNITFADDYLFDIAPNDDLIVEIYRQQQDTGNYQLTFYGVVSAISAQNNKITVTAPSIFTTYMDTEFPNIYFQSNCNHTLFDAGCGLDPALFKVSARITSISPDRLTLGFEVVTTPTGNGADPTTGDQVYNGTTFNSTDVLGWDAYLTTYSDIAGEASRQVALGNFTSRIDYAAWFQAAIGLGLGNVFTPSGAVNPTHTIMEDGWLVPGKMKTLHEERLILVHAANVIQISYPFRTLSIGDTVELYAGCDHTSNQCRFKFNNGDNFLGWEFIPYINPFIVGVR